MAIFGKKDKSRRLLLAVLECVNNKAVKYVARRDTGADGNPVETVLGKSGAISCRNGGVSIVCNGKVVFRSTLDGLECHELLSRDGAVFNGVNLETGQQETVAAYYSYYRK